MAALDERKLAIVRNLVETAPDRVVGNLRVALAETAEDSALGGVRRLVETEVLDRTLRNTVLRPVAPMFVGGGDDPRALTFPARALTLIWRGLRATEPARIAEAQALLAEQPAAHAMTDLCDQLVAIAAGKLRARSAPEFATAAEICDAGRPDGAEVLASCLDLGPVVRSAALRLPEWIAHRGSETTAAARLAYKDAVEVAEDAGPRFFDMLAAQMSHPWMVLRVICAVMDKPTERYLADSEMARFGETVLEDIDASLAFIAGLKTDSPVSDGRSAAQRAELVVQQILEVETNIDLNRETGWGKRVHQQRASLAGVVEGRLKEAEKAVTEALPMHAPRHLRGRRQVPHLSLPPDQRLVEKATMLLSFSDALRATANHGGFAATRAKLVERLSEFLAHYVDEVVDLIRCEEAEDLENATAFLNVAADLSQLVTGEKAAELVRRRAHAALHAGQTSEAHG